MLQNWEPSLNNDHDFLCIGELPVKINMNWVPPIHPAVVESEPPPPPTNREENYSESTIQTESEALVPALPPKPNNNWSVNSIQIEHVCMHQPLSL